MPNCPYCNSSSVMELPYETNPQAPYFLFNDKCWCCETCRRADQVKSLLMCPERPFVYQMPDSLFYEYTSGQKKCISEVITLDNYLWYLMQRLTIINGREVEQEDAYDYIKREGGKWLFEYYDGFYPFNGLVPNQIYITRIPSPDDPNPKLKATALLHIAHSDFTVVTDENNIPLRFDLDDTTGQLIPNDNGDFVYWQINYYIEKIY